MSVDGVAIHRQTMLKSVMHSLSEYAPTPDSFPVSRGNIDMR